MTLEQKIKKLLERKKQLEDKYYNACKKEHERMNNMGWGYGMRHSKINFSTNKSDALRKKIKICDMEIQQLKNEMQSEMIATIINHNINK